MTLFELPQVVLRGGPNLLVLVPHPSGGAARRVGMTAVGSGKPV